MATKSASAARAISSALTSSSVVTCSTLRHRAQDPLPARQRAPPLHRDKLEQFRFGARSLARSENTVPALRGAGILDD
ncbi:hypothetical protein ACFOZ0_01555 [Streptomyces yaanensis]|uniref:Uncharacterized protein n=1 Tax=Streptomyces yaanensis TaxID=1142239 RepID=A0ABV7S5B4_9ACTN|nr:hypothetical protein [Streptomyces sp. CGMCC 4.7035]WNC03356.1 hypothetical protein Q2K21_16775 [Streptomyces sp. CGMCC 4.7035]